jgi:hypothetical protein
VLKVSVYLQTTLASETRLAQGLSFALWRTSEIENPLIQLVDAPKQTLSKMDGQLSLFLKTHEKFSPSSYNPINASTTARTKTTRTSTTTQLCSVMEI